MKPLFLSVGEIEVPLQRFHFFPDIFIHFPYRLTTGKSRPQKTWQTSTDFPLKEGLNRGRKGELKGEKERERETL